MNILTSKILLLLLQTRVFSDYDGTTIIEIDLIQKYNFRLIHFAFDKISR